MKQMMIPLLAMGLLGGLGQNRAGWAQDGHGIAKSFTSRTYELAKEGAGFDGVPMSAQDDGSMPMQAGKSCKSCFAPPVPGGSDKTQAAAAKGGGPGGGKGGPGAKGGCPGNPIEAIFKLVGGVLKGVGTVVTGVLKTLFGGLPRPR